jgi:hypothetical protein
MALDHRLARLEQRWGSCQHDLNRLVLRAFQGDRLATWHFSRRLRRAMGLDELPRHEGDPGKPAPEVLPADPELFRAIKAVPQPLKDAMVARAAAQHGVSIEELRQRYEARRAELVERGRAAQAHEFAGQ